MKTGTDLFGLRFGSNSALQPSREDIERFLNGPAAPGSRDTRGQDLEPYRILLQAVTSFEQDLQQGASPPSVRDRMFYGVLAHSSFFHPALIASVELYRYLLHELVTLDFRKPSTFIASAEQERARLNPGSRQEAAKRDRLQDMIDERKRTIADLTKRRTDLAAELRSLARYLCENISTIAERCETAIVVLVQLQLEGNEEHRLLEDIRDRFREELKNAVRQGSVTRTDLDTAKRDVDILSKELASILRDDIYALTRLYEAIHDHARRCATAIETLLRRSEEKREELFEKERDLFAKVGETFTALVAGHEFHLDAATARSETAHLHILTEKRAEMHGTLFRMLRHERRERLDRRSGQDRRTQPEKAVHEPEQRSGVERRTKHGRRKKEHEPE